MAADGAWLRVVPGAEGWTLEAGGRWVLASAHALQREMGALRLGGPEGPVRIDLTHLRALDTAGAVLLVRLRERLAGRGGTVAFTGVAPAWAALLDAADRAAREPPVPEPRPHPVLDMVARTGAVTLGLVREAGDLLGFLGLLGMRMGRTLVRPGRLRLTATVHHMEQVGFNALPIVGLLAFLIGVVLAYQGADQLRQFGAEIFVVNLLGISVLREIGILITAIIVAGRSGSAFTAEIGAMKVNQEIDALETLGLDPVELLVLPRTIALILTLPLLVFYADVVALAGGAVMSQAVLGIPPGLFLEQLRAAIGLDTLFVGLVKAPVFAFVIALVGCYQGLKVTGSAESIGRRTTQSVVWSIFLVITLDAAFSVLFSILGL